MRKLSDQTGEQTSSTKQAGKALDMGMIMPLKMIPLKLGEMFIKPFARLADPFLETFQMLGTVMDPIVGLFDIFLAPLQSVIGIITGRLAESLLGNEELMTSLTNAGELLGDAFLSMWDAIEPWIPDLVELAVMFAEFNALLFEGAGWLIGLAAEFSSLIAEIIDTDEMMAFFRSGLSFASDLLAVIRTIITPFIPELREMVRLTVSLGNTFAALTGTMESFQRVMGTGLITGPPGTTPPGTVGVDPPRIGGGGSISLGRSAAPTVNYITIEGNAYHTEEMARETSSRLID
jgi:hypothetical protein